MGVLKGLGYERQSFEACYVHSSQSSDKIKPAAQSQRHARTLRSTKPPPTTPSLFLFLQRKRQIQKLGQRQPPPTKPPLFLFPLLLRQRHREWLIQRKDKGKDSHHSLSLLFLRHRHQQSQGQRQRHPPQCRACLAVKFLRNELEKGLRAVYTTATLFLLLL